VNDAQFESLSLIEAAAVRAQTADLLVRLIAERHMSERRMAEIGKRDAMKAVTGRTALDKAIESTREMIGRMDVILAKSHADVTMEPAPVIAVRSRMRPAAAKTRFNAIPVAAVS
jgi:hypothetical protein